MAPSTLFCVATWLRLAVGQAATAGAPDGDCPATGECSPGARKAPPSPYFWPMARGPIGSHSTSPYRGPRDLASSLKWKWERPVGKYRGANSNGAPLIDGEKNIYTMFGAGIHKFSPDGRLLWEHWVEGGTNDIPALMGGVLYSTSYTGHVMAISMETGALVWRSPQFCTWSGKHPPTAHAQCDCKRVGADIAALSAHKGVVTFRSHEPPGGGACKVMAVNGSTGEFLWDYATDHLVWNYYPIFTEEGESILFQDSTGTVYHLGLDGRELWRAEVSDAGWYQTWTDGGLQIGPNGAVYAMRAGGPNEGPGKITAYRLSDGAYMWTSEMTPEAPNAWPAIGRMREGDPLTVVAPIGRAGGYMPRFLDFPELCGEAFYRPITGRILSAVYRGILAFSQALGDYSQALWGIPSMQPEVWGLDAETGRTLWKWIPPAWRQGLFRGELARMLSGGAMCIPNPVGNPTLDAGGNLYIGMLDGFVYHLARESSGPGVEVRSRYDAEGAFSNGGVSMAPGMMVIVSCDTLMVFRGEA